MTRLRFLLVSFFAAVAGCFGLRRKLTRADFTVEIRRVDDYAGCGPRVVALATNTRDKEYVYFASPSLEYVSEGIARMDVAQAAEDAIEDRIRQLASWT